MAANFRSLILTSILLAATVCNAARISGTYVAHGQSFAQMLQLTETSNGQISGVFTSVTLATDGDIHSEQAPLTGVIDSGQLTLNNRSGLQQFLGSGTVAGTVGGNRIQIHAVDLKGNVASTVFVQSTPAQFKTYADQLKSRGAGIVLSTKLLNGANELRDTVRKAEQWISNADLLAQKIPAVKARYEQLESGMRSLISQERATADSYARSQISYRVHQGDFAGGQVDFRMEQVWDFDIVNSGANLSKQFSEWDGKCGTPEQLRKDGATAQAAETWVSACKQAVAERDKFLPVFKRISEQRAELKSFQTAAAARRKSLVDEANLIE